MSGCERPVRYEELDVGDDAVLGSLADTFLGEADKTNIKVVQQPLANAEFFIQHAIAALFLLDAPEFVPFDRPILIYVVDKFDRVGIQLARSQPGVAFEAGFGNKAGENMLALGKRRSPRAE